EYVPVALEFLVRKGLVIEFVSRLSDVEVCEILKRVLPTFGVTRITRTKAADLSSLVMTPEPACFGAAGKSDMPWRDVVPESDTPRLRPVQQLFVGIVLMVHRAPVRVRTLSFAREVERWMMQVQEPVIEVPGVPELLIEEIVEAECIEFPEIHAPIRENPIHTDPVVLKPDPPPEGS